MPVNVALLVMENVMFDAFDVPRLMPALSFVNVLVVTVTSWTALFAPRTWRPLPKLPLNVEEETFTIADAELRAETNRPCAPLGETLLENVEPVTFSVSEPVSFSTYIWLARLLWMLAFVSVAVPFRFWNSRPLSPASSPAFFTSELTSEKPETLLPLMPICTEPSTVTLVKLAPVTPDR